MSERSTERVDAVVVGGGVIGLAVAHELLEAGADVWVLERGRCGAAATWASGGMLAPVSEADQSDPELTALGQYSLGLYPEFVHGLERAAGRQVGYRTEGSLWIARDRDDAEELSHLQETLRRRGLRVERLSRDGVAEREPHLSARILGGLYIEQDHQVDPRGLVDALVRSVAARGGRVLEGVTVEEVQQRAGRVTRVGARRSCGGTLSVQCDTVVLATGAWGGREIRLPVEPPALRPVKGQLVRLCGAPLLRHVVRSPDVYLVPRADGELLVGATMEEMGYDERPTAGAALDLLRHAWEVLPAVYDLAWSEISVGLRSATEDHRPLIGPAETDGLYFALGHYRNGVLLAPATARLLARRIVRGTTEAELAPFLPARGRASAPAPPGGST